MNDLERLKALATDTLEQKRLHRLALKLSERAQEIKDAPFSQKMDFYCEACERDFGGLGIKSVQWPKGSVWFAFYRGKCPEGHIAIRRITDKLEDPYFYKSPFIRRQQVEFSDAILTPDSPRFKLLYPEAYAKLVVKSLQRDINNQQ